MTPFEALLLGALQGLTEFLPVSSSGHLVIAQNMIPNFSQPGILFDAVLHLGTMFAVIVFFWQRIISLKQRMVFLLLIGSIPAGLIGILFSDFFEALFGSVMVVGVALMGTGVMNWITDRINHKPQTTKDLKIFDALVIGAFQAIAIVPGISRSGSTIFAAVSRGVSREQAATFSFILSIPAVFGATLLQFTKYQGAQIDYFSYLIGFVAAFIVGYFSIAIVMKILLARRFKIFAVYCILLGLTMLLINL